MMSAKMPGGFGLSQVNQNIFLTINFFSFFSSFFSYSLPNQAKNYLSSDYKVGPNRTNGILLFALTTEPATRLGSESDAKNWLDKVVSTYSAYVGVPISKDSPAAAPSSSFASFAPAPAVQQ